MLDPEPESSITVDDIDLTTVPRELVRQAIGVVPQETFILCNSVRVNADPTGNFSDQEIVIALEKVGLWTTISLKGGLDFAPMEALALSPGQKQLFALSRVILRSKKIIVLDEAMRSVDEESKRSVERIIRTEFRNTTVISVAHQLDTIRNCDKILVLDNARLVEYDSPDELLRRDSAFRKMFHGV
jgi:ABC-type multidrug transport system fused ATPase/permease subunit